MYGYESFLINIFFSPVISTNTLWYLKNTFHEFKVLKKVIKNETFNIDFHYEFIEFWIIFLLFSLHIYIYIYIYICVCVCVCVIKRMCMCMCKVHLRKNGNRKHFQLVCG